MPGREDNYGWPDADRRLYVQATGAVDACLGTNPTVLSNLDKAAVIAVDDGVMSDVGPISKGDVLGKEQASTRLNYNAVPAVSERRCNEDPVADRGARRAVL
jgi:hypothetical protein